MKCAARIFGAALALLLGAGTLSAQLSSEAVGHEETSYADQITFVTDRPGHDLRYAIDPTRIREELGWRPSVTLEQGLRKTVEWYLANEDWWRPLQQVAEERRGVSR